MITKKPLLSENIKDFMDYALDTIKAMDGAPEHTPEEKIQVETRLTQLREYLDNVKLSYLETTPNFNNLDTDAINFSGTGHS